MGDSIQTRNVIAQTSLVEKIKQVQQQQGDLHHSSVAHPKKDEHERKMREVQDSHKSAGARMNDRKREGAGGEGGSRGDGEREPGEIIDESGTGGIIDIKV